MSLIVRAAAALVILATAMVLAAAIGLWNTWWAVQIWRVLVMPLTNWPALPVLALYGGVLMGTILRPKRSKEAGWQEIWKMMATGPLLFTIAWVLARVFV